MPLTPFAVVACAALSVAMSRAGGSNQVSTITQSLSAQALYAADSGAQYALHQLLFNGSSRAVVDTRCGALDGNSIDFNTTGLAGCRANLSCSTATDSQGSISYYNINSRAEGGGGQLLAAREVAVSTYLQ